MTQSILDSTKKMLGLAADYTAFDLDVITHINSVFSVLTQLGIGPERGFSIEDSSITWDEYLGGNKLLHTIKSYVYLRVRVLFDPPSAGYVLTAVENQIKELEWRINMEHEMS